ncbi:MAG: hypothetical protein HY472_00660 [Candidatus Sungbacteria bacterium]|nr:hypothetical protein [Candidatus Sungbacteria bacterium]
MIRLAIVKAWLSLCVLFLFPVVLGCGAARAHESRERKPMDYRVCASRALGAIQGSMVVLVEHSPSGRFIPDVVASVIEREIRRAGGRIARFSEYAQYYLEVVVSTNYTYRDLVVQVFLRLITREPYEVIGAGEKLVSFRLPYYAYSYSGSLIRDVDFEHQALGITAEFAVIRLLCQ